MKLLTKTQPYLLFVPLLALYVGMISATPVAAATVNVGSTSTGSGFPAGSVVIAHSIIYMNGTHYPVEIALVPSTAGISTSTSITSFPGITASGSGVSPLTTVYWQYGVQWASSSTYYGAVLNMSYFSSQSSSTPSFTYWAGITDNKGNFYQSGISWWHGAGLGCYSYTGWSVDDYNGGSLGTSNCWPLPTAQWSANSFTSGYEAVYVFVYNGQWYSGFYGSGESGSAPSGIHAFPGGADGGSYVSGDAGAITEGWTTSGFSAGQDEAKNLYYVTSVSYSSGTFFVSLADATSGSFYVTSNSGNYVVPPTTAHWNVAGSCPYTYESYFTSSSGTLPAYGSPVSAC